MADDLTFVQGDTAPKLKGQILKKDGTALDISTGVDEVRFQMRKPDDRRFTVDAEADVVTAAEGRVEYSWGTNDLSVAGDYQAQFEIHFSDGKVQTTEPPVPLVVRKQ